MLFAKEKGRSRRAYLSKLYALTATQKNEENEKRTQFESLNKKKKKLKAAAESSAMATAVSRIVSRPE